MHESGHVLWRCATAHGRVEIQPVQLLKVCPQLAVVVREEVSQRLYAFGKISSEISPSVLATSPKSAV